MDLGSKILEQRQGKGMTQEELAVRIGVTPQALSKWERNQSLPDTALLADLCRVLGVSADYLLSTERQKITENEDSQAEDIIRKKLRNCCEPLILDFGKELVPVFVDNSSVKGIIAVRSRLADEGILMPLVRIRDEFQLKEYEFRILSYQKVLYYEELSKVDEDTLNYILEVFEKIVRENYADILNRDIVKELVDNLRIKYPALVNETVPERISYGLLTDVLKGYVARGGSMVYLVRLIEIMDCALRQNPGASVDELVQILLTELN